MVDLMKDRKMGRTFRFCDKVQVLSSKLVVHVTPTYLYIIYS